MRRNAKIIIVVAVIVAITLLVGIYGLSHGYFDPGRFTVKQAEWSSSHQVALVVERINEKEMLGGLDYFVLIGDHLYSQAELKHAYHSDAVVFNALSTCLDLHWESPVKLVVACRGATIEPRDIGVQKRLSNGITIEYERIAIK